MNTSARPARTMDFVESIRSAAAARSASTQYKISHPLPVLVGGCAEPRGRTPSPEGATSSHKFNTDEGAQRPRHVGVLRSAGLIKTELTRRLSRVWRYGIPPAQTLYLDLLAAGAGGSVLAPKRPFGVPVCHGAALGARWGALGRAGGSLGASVV